MKKNRDENNVCMEVAGVDRILLTALKKNLKVAKRLSETVSEGPQKETLLRMIKRHPLSPPEKTVQMPVQEPDEGEKRTVRLSRYLGIITEGDFVTLLEVVKSLHRRQKETAPIIDASDGKPAIKGHGRTRGEKSREGQEPPTSGASSSKASDSNTEPGTP